MKNNQISSLVFLIAAACCLITATLGVPINGKCGPDAGGASCDSGLCCSQYGYCGTGPDYCGFGCQKDYGKCANPAPYYTTCSESNTVGVTFDDGPFKYTKGLLELLDSKNKTKVTFFVNGNNYDCIYNYADVLIEAHKAGHLIGAHSWSHPDLTQVSYEELKLQITKLEDALRKILGVVPRYFRLPFGSGSDSPLIMDTLGSYGYTVIGWDVDTRDSLGASVEESEQIYRDNVNNPPTPHLVLEHDALETTAKELAPFAVDFVKGQGYSIAPVAACLGNTDPKHWYKEIGKPGKRDKTWVC